MADSEEIQVQETAELDYAAILENYRRRQMIEHLTGPVVSMVVHVILVIVAVIYMVPKPQTARDDLEITMEELEIKELDQKVLEELQELEEIPEDIVPTVDKPEVPQEAVEVAVTDDFSDQMAQTDDDMDLTDVLDIKPSQTPLKLSSLYGGRTDAGRQSQLKQFKGSVIGETAVLKALRWLKAHQNADGSWTNSEPEAMGGLALLAFLAHGETPMSEEFGQTVQKAMQYLANRMMSTPESSRGGLKREYTNGIVTYALSEAYGLTKVPFLKPAMERGLGFIVRGQQDRGGWYYGYKSEDRWDLSVSGWQVQALKAGYVAGADVPGMIEAMDKSIHFLKNVTFKDGKFGYNTPGVGGLGMQGAGTLCLQLLNEEKSPQVRDGIKFISENDAVLWDDPKYNKAQPHNHPAYNWYYNTQVMFHAGRGYWDKWNKQFSDELVRTQKTDGHWECPGKEAERAEYDSVYTTTLCCLMLQVYYRYLPTYKMPKAVAKGPTVLELDDSDLGLEIE